MDLVPVIALTLILALGIRADCGQIGNCPLNEEYDTCGTACPPTCQNRNIQICTSQCIEGCFCKKGYLREGSEGRCVPEECKNVPVCKKDEKFTACATLCPPTCNQTEPRLCPLVCRTGCVCVDHYVRETKGGRCIPQVTCRKDCEKNEVYNECGTLCPGTCSQPVLPCVKKCAKGCFCKEGYILDDDTRRCIKKENCPKYFD